MTIEQGPTPHEASPGQAGEVQTAVGRQHDEATVPDAASGSQAASPLTPPLGTVLPAVAKAEWLRSLGPLGFAAVRLRLVVTFLFLGAVTLQLLELHGAVDAGSYDASLLTSLEREGLTVDASSLYWQDEPSGLLDHSRVFFLASRGQEPPDLYTAHVRTAARSAVLGVSLLNNLTHSSSAAEGRPHRLGPFLAFSVQLGTVHDAFVVMDTRGEDPALTADWPTLTRLQNAISNLQDTGSFSGVGVRRYPLLPAPETLHVAVVDDRFELHLDGEVARIDPRRALPELGGHRVMYREGVKGRPGRLTWLVDTVRKLPFVGAERIAWLEHRVFGITDTVSRAYHGVVRTDVEAEVREALAVTEVSEQRRALLNAKAPEIGFPPPALLPKLKPAVRGEGEWLPVVDDPFVNAYPNAPPAFYQTFIRVDPEREFTRVYVTLWDPRQVDLHLVMGTREPESATGETGDGTIPRDPQTLSRLVGAFNGGFQALHGEFGMMAQGRVYLPPKPFAATVAIFDDGSVGMGSWPGPGKNAWDEAFAKTQIPEGMVALRQNLTSVVEDGEWNPWKRWWWGAAPAWTGEQTYIHRSALCLTEEGFLGYFWGEAMGPEELGDAMLAVRCARGIHLDMNSKHTGFEFLHPIAPNQPAQPLARALTEAEYEGALPQAKGYRYRARKAVTTMTPLRFPRYTGQDPRDYFYLTLRPVLPGPDLDFGAQRIPFSTEGLPHAGFPHAFARARLATTEGDGTWLVRIDPSRLRFSSEVQGQLQPDAGAEQEPAELACLLGLSRKGVEGPVQLVVERSGAGRIVPVGEAGPGATILFAGDLLEGSGEAAIGIDADGFLLYAEANIADRANLAARMERAGVRQAIRLPLGSRLAFKTEGGMVAVDGVTALSARIGPRDLPIHAAGATRARVLFPEVEPRPYRFWGQLQDRRVRYFPEGERTFHAPEAELMP